MKQVLRCAAFLVASYLAKPACAETFSVRRVADDSVAFSGTLSDPVMEYSIAQAVTLADFSALDEPGEYYVDVPGRGKSVSFRIGTDVYAGELATLMLGFYGARSGVPIMFDHHGVHFEHVAGHTADGRLDYVDGQVGVQKDGTGGWYDAGDYGKYLPTAAESVNTLLFAWELFGDRLNKLSLPYLEAHDDGLPDYLEEVKWELDWILKMAYDDGSGRVHHKLNSPSFPGFVLPVDDPTTRYFSNYSTAATAEFVAATAKAARAFAPYDASTGGYSEKLLAAANTAYAYLQAHPDDVEYDASVLAAGTYQKLGADDRVWAACELWETTGDPSVLADCEARLPTSAGLVPNFDWDTTSDFGYIAYVLSKREGRDPVFARSASSSVVALADKLVKTAKASGYGRDYDTYYWGTNGVIARTCLLLQAANVLSPNPAYLDACTDQIGYLYGRNQYNRSQVTGAGVEPPLHPHHRISAADDVVDPYPGLLVGGGQSPTNWQDVQSNFQTNEVAINWSSALAFALAGFVQVEAATPSFGPGPRAAADCNVRLSSVGFVPGRSKVATVQESCELPSTFMCPAGPATLSGDTSGAPSVIDDLEDGDVAILNREGRQGSWFAFDDGSAGTRTNVELRPAGRSGSTKAACISGSGFTGWGGGIGLSLLGDGAARRLYDASAYTGISFWARGSATRFRAMVVDKYSDPSGALCTACYDHFQSAFTPSATWTHYTFTWKELTQLGFGDMQPNVCAQGIFALQFQWGSGDDFELCLDDVSFTTPAGVKEVTPRTVTPAGGGCGCRIGTREAFPAEAGLAVLGLLGLLRRRRTRGV